VLRRRIALLTCAFAAGCTADDLGSVPDARSQAADAPASHAAPDADIVADAPTFAPRYTADRTYSPVTTAIVRRLREIAAKNQDLLRDDVFMKAGDSITVAPQFMACFAGTHVALGENGDLAPDIALFAAGDAAGTSPFGRESQAATIGWSADSVLEIDTQESYLDEELAAVFPRYALVMFGTNDADSRSVFTYWASMMTIVDDLADQGVIPILSTVPPQDGTSAAAVKADAKVRIFNAVVRAIAEARELPFMDFWRELQPLPAHGLGPDALHPNAAPAGACDLTAAGLQYGYNVRNLLAMRSLARVRDVVAGGAPPDPEPDGPAVLGAGSYVEPFAIAGLPFSDLRDTTTSTNVRFVEYSGCQATQDESGPEYVYRLVLEEQTTVHAYVFARSPVDIDVQLLSDLDVAACLERGDRELTAELAPGTYYFVLDSFVPADGTPRAGEYLFLVLAESMAE
jgi:hypothetical protein